MKGDQRESANLGDETEELVELIRDMAKENLVMVQYLHFVSECPLTRERWRKRDRISKKPGFGPNTIGVHSRVSAQG